MSEVYFKLGQEVTTKSSIKFLNNKEGTIIQTHTPESGIRAFKVLLKDSKRSIWFNYKNLSVK